MPQYRATRLVRQDLLVVSHHLPVFCVPEHSFQEDLLYHSQHRDETGRSVVPWDERIKEDKRILTILYL